MKLIIVESPTKAKTIGKFLGDGFDVASSYGHVRDLPERKLGVDIADDFKPQYVIPIKAKPNVKILKEKVAKADTIILATDEDREGEAIAWHLTQALGLANSKSAAQNSKHQIQRIVFHEITKRAIEEALEHPRALDMNMVNAQQARRVLDRIVGYKLSPFLWKKVAKGLSAGRVQSVALRLIAERENEIRLFIPQEYWTISALLASSIQHPATSLEADLFKIEGKTLDKFAIDTKEAAEKIVAALKEQKYHVASIEKKELRRHPLPPFITSTLQQDAARRLGFSSARTMLLAQRLYEAGHITYMRTDSVNLSTEALAAAKNWLKKTLGEIYSASAPRRFENKSKLAQEAHEAVRPTHIDHAPGVFSSDPGESKLYKLIWERLVASQMPPAIFDSTTITISAGPYELKATGTVLRFDGFLKIWPMKYEEKTLPAIAASEKLQLQQVTPAQHFTEPPARYSEATLIKTLEENGIGRPSTYAPTIATIQKRNYVAREAGRFHPTEIGELVNKVLTENFPKVVDVDFTAKMEDGLDAIANGKEEWQKLLADFYGPFSKNLEEKYQEVQKKDLIPEATGEICEKCSKPMIIRMSRFGKFMACSGFPECRNTKKLTAPSSHPEQGEGSGPKKIGMKCPTCIEGEVVERYTKKGRRRRFWGCSKYPKCMYATWKDPRL